MRREVYRLGSRYYLWHKPIISNDIPDISSEGNREFFFMQFYFFLANVHVHMNLENNASE